MIRIIVAAIATTCAAVSLAAGPAFAGDGAAPSPLAALAGTYMQNVACKANGKNPKAFKVTIAADKIVSSAAVCKVLASRRKGKAVAVHVECIFPSKPLMGNITFTRRRDKTIKFVDQDQNYTAILYPCPN